MSISADILKGTLYIFNLKAFLAKMPDSAAAYDYLKLAAALQGLVNREKPQIYFIYENTSFNNQYNFGIDKFWLGELSSGGRYFSRCIMDHDAYAPSFDGFFKLMSDFSDFYDGFVLWDDCVPATANVASTAAGAQNLLPVCYCPGDSGSLYNSLFINKPARQSLSDVRLDLTGKFTKASEYIPDTDILSTGSPKNDAYLWAKAKYLDAGLTNPLRMAYCTDSWIRPCGENGGKKIYPAMFMTTLANSDFHIAQKAFFWDLSPDCKIAPIDDRNQNAGEDVRTLCALLLSQARRSGFCIFNVSGFVPWNFKYTSTSDPEASKMGDVESEWTMINRISSYGGQTEADANAGVGDISNLSALSHVPLNPEFRQNNAKGRDSKLVFDPETHYFMIYMGDYDSASWTSSILSMLWENSKNERGKYPLSWPVATGISGRIPHLFNYIYENATQNDFFVAGDNGTAYLNASMFEPELRPAGMPDMLPVWEEYNIKYNRRFDVDITGFYINTSKNTLCSSAMSPRLMESISKMTPAGASSQTEDGYPGYYKAVKNPESGAVTLFINY